MMNGKQRMVFWRLLAERRELESNLLRFLLVFILPGTINVFAVETSL